MVFLTEFINSFFAAGELCAVHIVDQENSTCRQTFIKQRKRSGSRSVEVCIQRYETESHICDILAKVPETILYGLQSVQDQA